MGLSDFTYNSVALASEYADVSNIRSAIYKMKTEIINTPMVKEIVQVTFPDTRVPKYILINSTGIFARIYDRESDTYHPNGVLLYEPAVSFDYVFSAALCSLFQDLYPNVYEINKYTVQQLSDVLGRGTWCVSLTMQDQFARKDIQPAFDIYNTANVSIESLPVTISDKTTKRAKRMPKASLILGIVASVMSVLSTLSVLFALVCGLTAVIGIVTGLIGCFANEKGKAIWGIVLSCLAFFGFPGLLVTIIVFLISSILF